MSDSQRVASPSVPGRLVRSRAAGRRLKRGAASAGWAMLGILLSVIMWELVKAVGSVVPFPFNTSDTTMPNVWTMVNGAF